MMHVYNANQIHFVQTPIHTLGQHEQLSILSASHPFDPVFYRLPAVWSIHPLKHGTSQAPGCVFDLTIVHVTHRRQKGNANVVCIVSKRLQC